MHVSLRRKPAVRLDVRHKLLGVSTLWGAPGPQYPENRMGRRPCSFLAARRIVRMPSMVKR